MPIVLYDKFILNYCDLECVATDRSVFVSKNKIVLVFLSDRSLFKYLQHVL